MPPWSNKKKYSEEVLQEAVDAVKCGHLSYRQAQEQYGVPRATIRDHISGQHNGSIGHPSELNPEEETMIKDLVKLLADWGFPFTGRHGRLVGTST